VYRNRPAPVLAEIGHAQIQFRPLPGTSFNVPDYRIVPDLQPVRLLLLRETASALPPSAGAVSFWPFAVGDDEKPRPGLHPDGARFAGPTLGRSASQIVTTGYVQNDDGLTPL